MTRINAPRGTADTLPSESWKWQVVEGIARTLGENYHFQEIRTPIFEHSELFHRGVGETSDIVHKETYTFMDRGERSITLRPEGTAGVARAMIEHSLIAQEGARKRSTTSAPTSATSVLHPAASASTTSSAPRSSASPNPKPTSNASSCKWTSTAAPASKNWSSKSTAWATAKAKSAITANLVEFLSPKRDFLSEDSQRRLEENPLRILDSKDPATKPPAKARPGHRIPKRKIPHHFDRVQQLLTDTNSPYRANPNLVRGFDYYTDTLWEVVAGGLGAQNALGGGGRYDNLVEQLGGRPTPGVGFGSGLERFLLALEGQNVILHNTRKPLIWLVALGEPARAAQWKLLRELRSNNIPADMDYAGRGSKAQFKMADKSNASLLNCGG